MEKVNLLSKVKSVWYVLISLCEQRSLGSLGIEKIFELEAVVDAPEKLRVGFLSPAFTITSENPAAAEGHPEKWYLAL